MQPGRDLGGKCEVCSSRILIADNYPCFVDNLTFSNALKKWAGEAMRNDFRVIAAQKLRYPADPVADNVLQQRAGELSYPMLTVPQKGPRIAGIAEVVAVDTLHMNRLAAQVALLY